MQNAPRKIDREKPTEKKEPNLTEQETTVDFSIGDQATNPTKQQHTAVDRENLRCATPKYLLSITSQATALETSTLSGGKRN